MPYDNSVYLTWDTISDNNPPVTIYVSTENKFKEGGKENWIKLATVNAGINSYKAELKDLPAGSFYKFVVETKNNHLNRWIIK